MLLGGGYHPIIILIVFDYKKTRSSN